MQCFDFHYLQLRAGFTDCDDFGFGLIAQSTWTGRIDAPDFMPQGSMLNCHPPMRSAACRDVIAGRADIGIGHAGPERTYRANPL